MDDDEPEYSLSLNAVGLRYAEIYPSMIPRLREIMASRDPKIRARLAALAAADMAQREGRLRRLASVYGLTPAEARVALHVIDGGSLATYAQLAAVSVGTARTQLKSVFAKTGVSRQAELIKLGQAVL